MEFQLKDKIQVDAEVGSVCILKDGRVRYLVQDAGKFFFVSFVDGAVTSSRYYSIKELQENYDIERVIPSNKLRLTEL